MTYSSGTPKTKVLNATFKVILSSTILTLTYTSHAMRLDAHQVKQNTTNRLIQVLDFNSPEEALALYQTQNTCIDYELLTHEVLQRSAGSTFESISLPILRTAETINRYYTSRLLGSLDSTDLMEKCIEYNRLNIFELLLAKGNYSPALLTLAINRKHAPIINLLINSKNFAQDPNSFSNHLVCATNPIIPLEILHSIIIKGKELGWSTDKLHEKSEYTPLISAFICGNAPAMQLLLDEGCGTIAGLNSKQHIPILYQKLSDMKKNLNKIALNGAKECLHVLLSQKKRLINLDNTFALRLAVLTDLTNEIPPLIFDGAEYNRAWLEEDNVSLKTKQALTDAEKDYYKKQCQVLVDNAPLPVALLSIIQDYVNPEDRENAAAETA